MMNEKYLLVIEDDDIVRDLYRATLESAGFTVLTATDGQAGLKLLAEHDIALVLCDECMSPMSGHEFLQQSHARPTSPPVLMISGYANIRQAVEAMRDGAVDYLIKPVTTNELLRAVESHILPEPPTDLENSGMVAIASSSKERLALAQRAAVTDATVLITGPSGTGKEVMARYVHAQSVRADAPFVPINCAAIPATMLEATLFGYEKGAFTHALQATPGKFEQAQGGTLLLDEISEMSLELQAKLLRVLQEREVERLGARTMIKLDLRVIATSNRDLAAAVRGGWFREDLYFRLSVFPLRLESLAARPADILPIAESLLKKFGEPRSRLTAEAAQALLTHSWPGNVRELENLIQRALILADDAPIRPCHLQFDETVDSMHQVVAQGRGGLGYTGYSQAWDGQIGEVSGMEGLALRNQSRVTQFSQAPGEQNTGQPPLRESLRHEEQTQLIDALNSCRTRKAAAGYLGISERTLRYKMARLRDQGVILPPRRRVAY